MRVTFPGMKEVSEDWKVARTQVQRDLDKAGKTINASWATEHTTDGAHGDVTATSVSVQGATMGEWIDLPFAPTRFSGDGDAVWTVAPENVNYLKAMRIGQLVCVMFRVENTILSVDTSDALYIKLPEFNAIPTAGTQAPLQVWFGGTHEWTDTDNSTRGMGTANAEAQPYDPTPLTLIALNRLGPATGTFSNWAVSADLSIGGILWFPVNASNLPLPYSFV